jgi:hypothetical protein
VAYTARTRTLRARLRPDRRFAALLYDAYPLRPGWLDWPETGTIACRCEETRWAEIGQAVAAGAADVRSVKGLIRCGMGYCQGRICGPIAQNAVAAAAGRPLGDVGDLHSRPAVTPGDTRRGGGRGLSPCRGGHVSAETAAPVSAKH